MKVILGLFLLVIVSFISYRTGQNQTWDELIEKQHLDVLMGERPIGLSDFYKRITGYDSVQLINFQGQLEVNFCYPNKWEFEKWKIDSFNNGIIKK